ncbi:MAG: hypothetical protein IPG17_21060 [Sandaracinaceae bacterium]|nr:hypothetical protein [Sandaracinaceae bacterium]
MRTLRAMLMMQGIVGTCILLPLHRQQAQHALGLDLADPALEVHGPALRRLLSIRRPPADGPHQHRLPLSANRTVGSATVTAVVTQRFTKDGIEDGHEVVFQTTGPEAQYRCFLEDFAAGRTPVVPAPDAASCD